MPELLVVPLRYMETEHHAERIKAQAAKRGLSLSAFLRSIVRMHTDPNGETLRLCQETRRQREKETECANPTQ